MIIHLFLRNDNHLGQQNIVLMSKESSKQIKKTFKLNKIECNILKPRMRWWLSSGTAEMDGNGARKSWQEVIKNKTSWPLITRILPKIIDLITL